MNGKPVLFTTVFQREAKREQIFWVIIDISMFAVGIRDSKGEAPLSKLGDVLNNPKTGNCCPKIFSL